MRGSSIRAEVYKWRRIVFRRDDFLVQALDGGTSAHPSLRVARDYVDVLDDWDLDIDFDFGVLAFEDWEDEDA